MANASQFTDRLCTTSTTLANGATKTGVVDLVGTTLCGLIIDGAITNTSITFEVCDTSGGTFRQLLNTSASAVTVTVASNKATGLASSDFEGWRFIKLVAGGAQSGDITIKLQSRPV